MSKASETELAKLHGRVAQTMLEALDNQSCAAALIVEFNGELPDKVLTFLEKVRTPNPALLTAVSKFLKDNDITAALDDSDTMTELEKRLSAKRNRPRAVNDIPFADVV